MAVRIRLKRFGRKKKPIYRVVAAKSSSQRDGGVIEELGFYDPHQEPRLVTFKEDRVKYWLGEGANPSEAVERLLAEEGIIAKVVRTEKYRTAKDVGIAKKDRGKEPEAPAAAPAPAEPAPVAEEAPSEAETPAEEAPAEESK